MTLYALGDLVPQVHPSAYVHPDAVVIGDVVVKADSSIWPGAVLRGDSGRITVGERTSVQDNCVLHVARAHPTTVGNDCVIGHLVHLEGCTVEDGCLVGNGAVVMHDAVIRTGAVVGAGAVVGKRTEVPSRAVALGVPARVRENAADPAEILDGAARYVRKARRFREQLRRIDG